MTFQQTTSAIMRAPSGLIQGTCGVASGTNRVKDPKARLFMHISSANAPEVSPTTDPGDRGDRGSRLVGWKDIAAYLGKTDRTVKRWGKDRGLPVYRVPGKAKTSVYAYSSELDQWLESAEAETETKADEELNRHPPVPESAELQESLVPVLTTARPTQRLRRMWLLGGLVLLLAVVTLDVLVRLRAVPFMNAWRNFAVGHRESDAHPAVSEAERRAASDFYLRGRYEWNQRTPASLQRALDLFTQAIVHNPGDARAYAGLADTYDLLREYSTDADNDAFPRAIAAAKKAVALDGSLAEAHRALAFAEMYGDWNFTGAETEFRRAIELDPKEPQARRWYANALAVIGRFPEAVVQMDKAQELDPASDPTLADKGWMLYNANRAREGIELLKEVERSSPEFYSPHSYLMQIDLDLRDYPSFLSEGQLAAQSSGDATLLDIIASSRAGFEQGGSRGFLQALYTKEKQYYATGKVRATLLAKTCMLMGKRQEVLDIMEDAYKRRDIEVLSFFSHPSLLTLKDDPRYQALARKINLPRGVRPGMAPPNSF